MTPSDERHPPAARAATVWRPRAIFLSSTFADMHDERDHLRKHAFSVLEEQLRERCHYLETVDLRVGVETAGEGEEDRRELKVLKVCLDEIERSRPFFVGLLGDRYGWVPPPERTRAAAREAGFEADVGGRSVTDLEILYGVLENRDQRRRSWFYLRELDYTGVPPEVRARFDDRLATDPDAAKRVERLEALKHRLRRELPDRVRTYAARWDPETGRVTGIEELARMVREDLWSDLDPETAEYLRHAPDTWQDADRRTLEDFVEGRTRLFVERPAVTGPLLEHALSPASDDATWGVCVTGESGSGKSSVFGWLYRTLSVRDDVLLLANAAGIDPHSGSVDRMLRRWISELAILQDVPDPIVRIEAERESQVAQLGGQPPTATTEEVEEEFAGLLGRAVQRVRVVLLLDALDQFEPSTRARHLTWLQRRWPPNARLVVTTIPGPASAALTEGLGVALVSLAPVSPGEARDMAGRYFRHRYHREPNARALDLLLAKRRADGTSAHGNPLWLELTLQELNLLEADDFARAEREFAELHGGARMEALVCSVAQALPADAKGVYGWLLERAERDFGREWTKALMTLIALGRGGWRESDLRALVPAVAGLPWDELAFAGVRRTLGSHLVKRGPHVQWDTFHASLREALLERDLADDVDQRRLHTLVAGHLRGLPEGDPLRASETMWHLLMSGDLIRSGQYFGSGLGPGDLDGAEAAFGTYVAARFSGDVEARRSWARSLVFHEDLTRREVAVLAARTADALRTNGNTTDAAAVLSLLRLAVATRVSLGASLSDAHHSAEAAPGITVVQWSDAVERRYKEYRDAITQVGIPRIALADGYAELWSRAWDLYKEGNETAALELLDDMIEVPETGITAEFIRGLLEGDRDAPLDPARTHAVFLRDEAQRSHPTRAFMASILDLMGLSYAALFDGSGEETVAHLATRAAAWARSVVDLFPNDPGFLTLAAQVVSGLGEHERGLALCERAVAADPEYERAVLTASIIRERAASGHAYGRPPSGSWHCAGGDISRSGGRAVELSLPLSLEWTFEPRESITAEIVCSDRSAVFSDLGGSVYAVDLDRGALRWRRDLEVTALGSGAIGAGAVVVGNSTDVRCLDLGTGDERWRATADDGRPSHTGTCPLWLHPDSSPLANAVFFDDDRIAVFDARNGRRLFEKMTPFDPGPSTGPCADAGHVYLPYSGRELLRLARQTGRFEDPVPINAKICAGPVVAGPRLIYGTNRATLEAIDLRSLAPSWTSRLPGEEWFVTSRPALLGEVVFAASADGTVVAVRADTGEILWQTDCGGEIGSGLMACGSAVFVLTSVALLALSVASGVVVWSHDAAAAASPCAGPVFANGMVLAGSDRIYAFR